MGTRLCRDGFTGLMGLTLTGLIGFMAVGCVGEIAPELGVDPNASGGAPAAGTAGLTGQSDTTGALDASGGTSGSSGSSGANGTTAVGRDAGADGAVDTGAVDAAHSCADVGCPACQQCVAGACAPLDDGTLCADDGDACTTDTCQVGGCAHTPTANDCGGRVCGDSPSGCHPCGDCGAGEGCDVGGTCSAACAGANCPECQACDGSSGSAVCVNVDGSAVCTSDEDACTLDQCSAGSCGHTSIANDCGALACGPSPSGCFQCGDNGGDCGTGEVCGSDGTCDDLCDSVNCPECTACDASSGLAVCEPAGGGSGCIDDGDSCTQDICSGGTCGHSPVGNDCGARACGSSPNGCFDCGSCDPGDRCNGSGACEAAPVNGSDGCGKAGASTGALTINTTVGGEARTYIAYVPPGYDPDVPLPLVFVWHGLGSANTQIRSYAGLEAQAAGGAIFVYPEGTATAQGKGWDLSTTGKDVDFFDDIYANVTNTYCVNEARVFSTGHSFGGYITNAVGCARGDVLRGIAPLAGGLAFVAFATCQGEVASLVIHGTADGVVSWDPEGIDTVDYWVADNGCDAAAMTAPVATAPSPCVDYQNCNADHPTRTCIHGETVSNGHGWPSWADDAIWGFFSSL